MKSILIDPRKVVLATILLLNLALLLPGATLPASVFLPMLVTNLALSLALVALLIVRLRRHEGWSVEVGFMRTHLVQVSAQLLIYVVWIIHFPPVLERLPLFFHQLVLAYACQLVLSGLTQRRTTLSTSNFPFVLSIGLFFWVLPAYYWLQLLVIPLGVAIRAFVTRPTVRGRKHIFNPAAVAVSVPFYIMMILGQFVTIDVPISFRNIPDGVLWIFLAGCLPQWVGNTGTIAFSAFTSFAVIALFTRMTLPPSVVIGMTLLVTDPVTSPISRLAQLLYGLAYTMLITFYDIVSAHYGVGPAYADKVVVLPLLNYAVPIFERVAAGISRSRLPRLGIPKLALALVYSVVFVVFYHLLGSPEQSSRFDPAVFRLSNDRTHAFEFKGRHGQPPRRPHRGAMVP